jgi:tetratricopeptide (TPR) repeat protein
LTLASRCRDCIFLVVHGPEVFVLRPIVVLGALLLCTDRAAGQRIKLSASLSDLESVAKRDSNDAAAHYNVSLAYWNAKRYDDVDSALHRAIRLDPEFPAAYIALAFLPYARRSTLADDIRENRVPEEWHRALEESDRMYRRAVLIDPLVEQRLADLLQPRSAQYLELYKEYIGEWFADYAEGFDLYRQAKYQAAYDRFERVYIAVNGASHEKRLWNTLLYWHGLSAAQVNQADQAVTDFKMLLDRWLDTENKYKDSTLRVPLRTNEFRYVLAVMQERAGHFNDAVALFREALENDIGLYAAHVHLAAIAEAHGQWDAAISERRNAVNANPDDASLIFDLGLTLAKAGRFAEAEEAFAQAIDANPRDARAAYYLGIVDQQLGKADAARSALTRFVAVAPSRYDRQIKDARQRLAALR